MVPAGIRMYADQAALLDTVRIQYKAAAHTLQP